MSAPGPRGRVLSWCLRAAGADLWEAGESYPGQEALDELGRGGLKECAEVLHWVSVAVLGLFLLIDGCEAAAQLGDFVRCRCVGLLVDLMLVLISLVLELTVDEESSVGGILIVARLWRYVRFPPHPAARRCSSLPQIRIGHSGREAARTSVAITQHSHA